MDIESLYKEVQQLYLRDQRPWIIGFSGGKDSTATLQAVFIALERLPKKKLKKTIHVVSSDTFVENPQVIEQLDNILKLIQSAADKKGLPFKIVKVKPEIKDTFFVNLIGKGYPAPNRWFRWCTDRMKIQPTNRYILKQVDEYGEVIIVLGARKAESISRAQTMCNYEIEGDILRRHSTLPNSYIYTPIEDWEVEDVWQYLVEVPSPWGANNRELVKLYRKAGGGECPLVIDKTTPSCGNSRFGCWVCTVIDEDKSMEGFIDSGGEWMKPLLEFRNWLKEIRDNVTLRANTRRDGGPGPGPFTLDVRHKLLEKLLAIQKKTGVTLILSEELMAIQHIWNHDGAKEDTVQRISDRVFKKNMPIKDDLNYEKNIQVREEELLVELCHENGMPVELIRKLRLIEEDLTKLKRRHGLYTRVDEALEIYL